MRHLLLLMIATCWPALADKKTDIEWIRSLDQAHERARAEAKPLLIEYWASWCDPCRRMDRDSWSDPRVVGLSKRYLAVSVNLEHPEDGDGGPYLVRALPTVVLADPWGRALTRREGYIHAADLAAMLAEVPPDFRPAREWHEALEDNPKDALALAGMGRFFVKAGSSRFASQFYSAALKSDSCDAKLRSSLTLATGMNHLILADWNTARKVLRQFLKDYPDAPGRDQALFGLVLADYRQGKRSDAAKTLSELERDYPSSESTVSASKLLRSGH